MRRRGEKTGAEAGAGKRSALNGNLSEEEGGAGAGHDGPEVGHGEGVHQPEWGHDERRDAHSSTTTGSFICKQEVHSNILTRGGTLL